jgi:ankyrin repeat protein
MGIAGRIILRRPRIDTIAAWLAGAAIALAGAAYADANDDMFSAIRLDNATTVRTLLLRGASANARDRNGTPAIVAAAREKSFEVTRTLASLIGTDVDATDPKGENALMLAAFHADLPTVQLLLRRGAEVNKPGWTPLHYAVTGGSLQITQMLLERHAFIDATSPNSTTPLMMAVRHRRSEIARLLVDEGADPTLKNESGWTAAEYARALNEDPLAAWLDERAAEYRRKYYQFQRPPRESAAPTR